jgi:hypothetical protein
MAIRKKVGLDELDDVAAELGVDDPSQQVHDVLRSRKRCACGHEGILPVCSV